MAGRPLLTDEQLSPAPPSLYLRRVGLLVLGWVGWLALRWIGWLALRACAQPVSRANQSHLPARCPKPQSTPLSNILTCFFFETKTQLSLKINVNTTIVQNGCQPHISPRLRCFYRKMTKKLFATCIKRHLFWFVIFPSC